MKNITSNNKDAFDKITHNLTDLENERLFLVGNMINLDVLLSSIMGIFPYASDYMASLNAYTKHLLDQNNKEVVLYEKMLRYLQLMITNGTYEYYTDSYYYDYFDKVINVLEASKHNRSVNITVFNYSLELGIENRSPSVSIRSNIDMSKGIITDEVYEDMLKRIPRR